MSEIIMNQIPMNKNPKFSPEDIAAILGQYPPTPEQAKIIASPHDRPAVVIAGAGSGKTETMSTRVIYLIANGLVEPDKILGLTFTRKSANDLAVKVRNSLRVLERSAEYRAKLGVNDKVRIFSGEPSISTYHSYANKIAASHSLRLGIEPPESMLGEAAAWQQVEKIVRNYDGDMSDVESLLSTVIKDVLKLVSQIKEHEVEISRITEFTEQFLSEVLNVEPVARNKFAPYYADVLPIITAQKARLQLLPIVERVINERARKSELTFDDQMSLAADIAGKFPDVGAIEREKYQVVLLDEYQDTSASQLRLMQALFGGGHPITAVGDPCQAIYAWRGASSDTIAAFPTDFRSRDGKLAESYTLLISWRNDHGILDLANTVSESLRNPINSTGNSNSKISKLGPKPTAAPAELSCGIYATVELEAEAIADHLVSFWSKEAREKLPELMEKRKKDPTFRFVESTAILVRNRSQISEIESALRALEIPVEVVGIDGLIHIPEVAEIHAMLRVIALPDAGTALMRLLNNGYWRIGPADIAALGKFARSRASEREPGRNLVERVLNGSDVESDELARSSIVEALDELAELAELSKVVQGGSSKSNLRDSFSEVGYTRLVALAKQIQRLRKKVHLPIPDLIVAIERELYLAVDVALTEHNRRYLDRFIDEANNFYSQGGSLSSFLTWIDVADREEGGLRAGGVEVRKDVVQILTVHGAKGGEWDLVVLPGLAEGVFPSDKSGENWLKDEGTVPFPLRLDRDRFKPLELQRCITTTDVRDEIGNYHLYCNDRKGDEEQRLAYVAVTRARSHLFCTTSWWRNGKNFVPPSSLYKDVFNQVVKVGGEVAGEIDVPPTDPENPGLVNPKSAPWPVDPLGKRRPNFETLLKALQNNNSDFSIISENTQLDQKILELKSGVELALQEQQRDKSEIIVKLPPRLSVSALLALATDQKEFAARIRRPLPFKPDPIARRGTAFHSWLEERFGDVALLDEDELPGSADEGAFDESVLSSLKEKWLASEWGNRSPIAVEVPFERTIAGVLLRGRMDAVYSTPTGGFEVVDWKTGSAKSGRELELAAIQLAMYRLAYAEIANCNLSDVGAAFHYVSSQETIRPADLLDRNGLIDLIDQVPTS